ncbi:hypothetical protein ACQKTA_00690 [Enterococcus sp. 22-H-5-01]|uniref:hypothetical protein n=1 Tax=Enterococcus sp. 22-H-5-01 TaxID=3418555 RepID=UPI003D008B69
MKDFESIRKDKLFFRTMVIFFITLTYTLIFSMANKVFDSKIINFFTILVYIIFLLSSYILLYAVYTVRVRKFNKRIKQITGWRNRSYGFPEELIFSILESDSKMKLDNLSLYDNVYKNISSLEEKEALYAYTRIKFYKDPIGLSSIILLAVGVILTFIASHIQNHGNILTITTLLIFSGVVFLTWYLSNKEKKYICSILEKFLSFRLTNVFKNSWE